MRVCVFVETFEFFTYICDGWQLSNNSFFPALAEEILTLEQTTISSTSDRIAAVQAANNPNIDILVIVRGGGGLNTESNPTKRYL